MDKCMEYCEKFGHDRDLEKFMRLCSPDSQKTQKECGAGVAMNFCMRTRSRETLSSPRICEALAEMPTRPLSVCCVENSKSLPNIDVQGQEVLVERFSTKEVGEIEIEVESDKEKILSISSENIQTPKKVLNDTRIQTPESIAKTHRRLEWDSLGDVGYKKSMSTSNISLLERSLLKEFFKESSVTSEPCTSRQAKEKELQQKQIKQKMVKCIKNTDIEQSTPPLACSTLLEGRGGNSTKRGAKPKMISQSTSSTSLQEKFEKYAQTSLIKPPQVCSQEIQCTMSSSNSIIGGTATPSSFEYYSSRSSKSSECITESTLHKQGNNPSEHPFITSITDLLKKRKVLCEKNQQKRNQLDNIRELQTKFQAALEDNKENQSHSTTASSTASTFSLTKQAPELDLGIQLICSLIDAKSVNGRQKKQLIRDIVKRITRMEASETSQSTNSSVAATTSNSNRSSSLKQQNIYDSVRSYSNSSNNHNANTLSNQALPKDQLLSEVLVDMLVNSELGISPISTSLYPQVSTQKPRKSTSNTSEELINANVSIPLKENIKRFKEHTPKFIVQPEKGHDKHFPCKTIQFEKVLKESNRKVTNMTAATSNKETQSDVNIKQRMKAGNELVEKLKNIQSEVKDSKTTLENKTSKSTQTSKNSTISKSTKSTPSTPSTCSSSSSSTTQDLTTQKFVVANKDLINNSNTDTEQPTMREWLNPLTQSEIEYEEKKREEIKKKAAAASQQTDVRREKHLKKSSKNDCGRLQQLNWIENEIHRLECLKHLLLKDETATTERTSTSLSSNELASRKENLTKDSTQTDKLYDTVYSDKSSVLSESAELLVKEIDVILEESNEDVINLKDNLKRTKERKKEIQIIYETPKGEHLKDNQYKKHKAKFRTIKETTTINEEQLLTDQDSETKTQARKQREKIDTPSTENSQEYESLRELVQHKKREFMEAYKTKKQNHYTALKQQQKEEFKYFNLQRQSKENPPTTTHAFTRNALPSSPAERVPKPESHPPFSAHVIYSTPASYQKASSNHDMQTYKLKETPIAATTTTTTTTSSSTSMFCISSDVSVPMGSQATSSTSTTTHQYDDVSGVAVQTSDSILRSKPIYGPQMIACLHTKRLSTHLRPYAPTSSTACIQVKPKGIAYVIEFDDNKNSNSFTNINLNSVDNKSIQPIASSTTNIIVANNVKASLSSETQLTLQDHLEKARPTFLQHSKERKAILNKLQSMRQARDRELREIIDNTSFNSLETRLKYLPPPPIQKVRILNTKEMKALTNKRFARLPEVVARKERALEEKKRRSNRILRDIFNRRLQKRVRNGKLSLNHSKTVI